MRILEGYNIVELEKGLFLAITIFTIAYCMWIVLIFFMELGKKELSAIANEDSKSDFRSKAKSIFTLYDTEDELGKEPDEEQSLFSSKRNRSLHSTTKTGSKGADDAAMPLLERSKVTTTTKRWLDDEVICNNAKFHKLIWLISSLAQ